MWALPFGNWDPVSQNQGKCLITKEPPSHSGVPRIVSCPTMTLLRIKWLVKMKERMNIITTLHFCLLGHTQQSCVHWPKIKVKRFRGTYYFWTCLSHNQSLANLFLFIHKANIMASMIELYIEHEPTHWSFWNAADCWFSISKTGGVFLRRATCPNPSLLDNSGLEPQLWCSERVHLSAKDCGRAAQYSKR